MVSSAHQDEEKLPQYAHIKPKRNKCQDAWFILLKFESIRREYEYDVFDVESFFLAAVL